MSAGHRALGSGFREVQRPMSVKRGPGISPDQAAEEGLCHQTCHAGGSKMAFPSPCHGTEFLPCEISSVGSGSYLPGPLFSISMNNRTTCHQPMNASWWPYLFDNRKQGFGIMTWRTDKC